MANGDLGYGIVAGSQTINLPPYTAFGTEVSVQKGWEQVWLRKLPMLAMIKSGTAGWNKGTNTNGTQMLIPIEETDMTTPAAGSGISSSLTPISPVQTAGATQAAYRIAKYHAAFWVTKEETTLINNVRGDFMQFKINQLNNSFLKVMANDASGTQADADNAMLGVQQPLSTSNTVGQISQSTDTDWASNVYTGVGAFSLDVLSAGIDAVDNRMGRTDFIFMGYSATNNLFDKLRQATTANERLVNQEFKAKFGFTNISYLDTTIVSDGRLTAGVIVGLDSNTWFYRGDDVPNADEVIRYPGTGAREHYYYMFAGVGCSNPARNWRSTGVS